jgi:DNA-binding CsgD family transcriptional regulator
MGALESARAGHGGAVFLVGESGIGKSRLAAAAADLAFAADMRLLRGRGSVIGPMVPFRSLTEALLSLLRAGEPINVSALGPYRSVLARLIPDWGEPPAGPDEGSLVILAEAVLRLTGLAGQGRGCLVTLDDLQDADAETLAVAEYLIDNLDRQPTLLVGTVRDEPGPALRLVRSASQRGVGTLLELNRLSRDDLCELAGACLDIAAAEVPAPAAELLWAGSAGNPFLAEELINGMVDGGLLITGDGRWQMAERRQQDMPATFARTLARRIDLLEPRARELLSAAAVLGNRFPLTVVRAVTGLPDRELLSYLHGEITAQLVGPDEQTPDWYAFRHRLIRESLLALLSPTERADQARRAAGAVHTVYPDLPGEWCQLAATLWEDVGEPAKAGRLFAEAGRRALAQGAANSAVTLVDRAWGLLTAEDAEERADTLETLLHALVEAGLVERALASVSILDQVGALDRRRRARLHTRLAWAAVIAGRTTHGLEQVDAARAVLGPDPAPEDAASIDVVAAHLVLDLPGPDQLSTAESLARRAATVAETVPLPIVACQAFLLLGAVVRSRDPDEATDCLQRAWSIAVRHELPIWEIHALVPLGNDDALRDGRLDRLEQARRLASQAGVLTARYQAETTIALHTVLRGDFAAAGALLDQVIAATIRLKLLDTTQQALLNRAVLYGHRGRRAEMDDALAELRRWDGYQQPRFPPRAYGLARAFCALLEENHALAREDLARALREEEANPALFQLVGRYGLNLLLDVLAGDAGWDRYTALTSAPASRLRWDRQFALFARAVLVGRDGDAVAAEAAVEEALRVGEPFTLARHLGLRLVAEEALTDGWGSPVDWLRAAEDYFHSEDIPAVAAACRALLRRGGFRVAQRRTGVEEIPPSLRSAGVTAREYEVLRLLIERLGNREIADRLHLSQRTVEKHVSSLIAKTGQPNRVALSKFAVTVN